ncbi:MAG: hypothetical protein AAF471_08605 [Myxococcota bacterium]
MLLKPTHKNNDPPFCHSRAGGNPCRDAMNRVSTTTSKSNDVPCHPARTK